MTQLVLFSSDKTQNVIQHVIVMLQLCQRTVGMADAVIRELSVLGKGVSHLNEKVAWSKNPFY